jgi:hypothetical protein
MGYRGLQGGEQVQGIETLLKDSEEVGVAGSVQWAMQPLSHAQVAESRV